MILILIFLLSINHIHTEIQIQERNFLFNKYVKEISFNKKNLIYEKIISNKYTTPDIKYDFNKIKELMKKYNFPETYNFFENENISPNIKNQKSCGSCWAFASTSALSYRFQKLGIDVDLSPQYLISCYDQACDGAHLINTQFYLVKNGTVTESCMPYSSGNKIVEECITKCKNNEEMKLFYSKNAYSIKDNYDEENFYDIVAVIIDQLINFGPVLSSIDIYKDFTDLHRKKLCSDIIYRHNAIETDSDKPSSHAVIIIGYGFTQNKFYWIIQNSWGYDFCDNGLAKIEFGQIGIERITFSEPYIDNNSTEKEINVNLILNEDCKFKFETNIGIDASQEDYFEMNFINVEFPGNNLYYQCGFPYLKIKNEGICEIDIFSYKKFKGYYKFSEYQSLKVNNSFNLNFTNLSENKFLYYGQDYIDAAYDYDLYISGENSSIVLIIYNFTENNGLISNIYPNINSKEPLKCEHGGMINNKSTFIFCKFSNKQIDELGGNNTNLSLVYDVKCGQKKEMKATVHKLDTTKYPIFSIKKMMLCNDYLIHKSKITLTANIEGSISEFKGKNSYWTFIYTYLNDSKYTEFLYCDIPKPTKIVKNFIINCYFYQKNESKVYFDNVRLSSYFYPVNASSPFEVIQDVQDIDILFTEDDNDLCYKNGDFPNPSLVNSPINYSTINKISLCIAFLLFLL